MQLFVSTTFAGSNQSDISETLSQIEGLDLDGVELGSTHRYCSTPKEAIQSAWSERLITHNFFPPTNDPNMVINLASEDTNVRVKSLEHAKLCIEFASDIGAEIYTVHPGFLSHAIPSDGGDGRYDFCFSEKRAPYNRAFDNMIGCLTELITLADLHGVQLALETGGSLTKPGVLMMERPEEFDRLFAALPDGVSINFNLAHTRFAAKAHGFTVEDFIRRYQKRFVAVEISHNNDYEDQHLPLTSDSYVFEYLDSLPDVPMVLEFRNASLEELKDSIKLMRCHLKEKYQ